MQTVSGTLEGGTGMKILKCLLMVVTAPVILALTLLVWLCTGLIYNIRSGAWPTQHGNCAAWRGCAYYLFPAEWCDFAGYSFLISPMGLPLAAIWLLGKVQDLKFAIQDWMYG